MLEAQKDPKDRALAAHIGQNKSLGPGLPGIYDDNIYGVWLGVSAAAGAVLTIAEAIIVEKSIRG